MAKRTRNVGLEILEGLRQLKRGEEIEFHQFSRIGYRHAPRRRVQTRAGVVNDAIDLAEAGESFVHDSLAHRCVGDIAGHA